MSARGTAAALILAWQSARDSLNKAARDALKVDLNDDTVPENDPVRVEYLRALNVTIDLRLLLDGIIRDKTLPIEATRVGYKISPK